jgi:riboflavin synthase alpha subunit
MMFSNIDVLKLKSTNHLKIGDSVMVEGLSLIVFGYSKGGYLAWVTPGSKVYRIE